MTAFDLGELRAALGGYRRIAAVDETGSTNADLLDDALAPPRSVLMTASQTHGRGRMGRAWIAPRGAVLACSVLLRPSLSQCERIGTLPLATGLGILEGLRDVVRAQRGEEAARLIQLKWPNDVLWEGKKLCGILAEGTGFPDAPRIVTGFGINISLREEDLPVPHATSLLLHGVESTPQAVALATLRHLDERLRQWEYGEIPALMAEYREVCATLGADVRVEAPTGTVEGRVESVGDDGRLHLRTVAGDLSEISAGDVTHVRRRTSDYA
ncbi:biotin--[acetyl-CoA-carboxylase] ligase [Corynebacterium uropygiale]|uniref:biotin--[biotin carboxyl-carrier protein] ligase n=1 Tax=Corynebacterium uropygiale TaxID=1775911 RepID=A0A9X1TYN7_9CORY|nr:biotin--[acetyl-CoA-carboxylase] ligase [Corynebacterium uropygiale]MCF4006036.1 biotin--[acetyl-CoA-carboxylase] ligase [Corynebacterium uropygiale]